MKIKIPKPLPVVAQELMQACDELEEQLKKGQLGILGLKERLAVGALSGEVERLIPMALANQRVMQAMSDIVNFLKTNIGPSDDFPLKIVADNPETQRQFVQLMQRSDEQHNRLAGACAEYSGCTVEELRRHLAGRNGG